MQTREMRFKTFSLFVVGCAVHFFVAFSRMIVKNF